jgi:hypothetical protein
MNKIVLALVCGSSFFALTVLNVNPALAKKLSPQDVADPTLRASDTQTVHVPVSQEDIQSPSMRSLQTERIKQFALQKFGCDCPGCQALASQMLLQGQLPTPQ